MKPRALDLFCKAGGATKGLQRAGFHVTGVDIEPQRRYCGEAFVQADALLPPFDLSTFDFIWASPPCQRYTRVWKGQEHKREGYADLVAGTRSMLSASGVPWAMENVIGAPLRPDLVLTGAMFDLDIVRDRVFEIDGFPAPFALAPQHMRKVSDGGLACVAGHGANNAWNVRRKRGPYTKWRDLPEALKAALRNRNNARGWSEAMGIDWMTRDELRNAVPPAYSEHIGRAALAWMAKSPAAPPRTPMLRPGVFP